MSTPLVWDTLPARYPPEHGTRYLLPCPVLGLGGLYEYCLVSADQARVWLLAGPCTSYITHPLLKRELERVVGIATPPGCAETLPQLGSHDDALLWQVEGYEMLHLQTRGDSRRLRELVNAGHYTLGLLRRLA